VAPEPRKRALRENGGDAIVDSFYAAHEGHSIDWLLANPQLQAAFHESCRETGLIGRFRPIGIANCCAFR